MAKGVVWLSVNPTAKGGRERSAPADLSAWLESKKGHPTAALTDPEGEVGRADGARVTPHMYLIDPQGKLIYAGAIDSKPTANPADIKTATNYGAQALDQALSGTPIRRSTSQAYGCAIQYARRGSR